MHKFDVHKWTRLYVPLSWIYGFTEALTGTHGREMPPLLRIQWQVDYPVGSNIRWSSC